MGIGKKISQIEDVGLKSYVERWFYWAVCFPIAAFVLSNVIIVIIDGKFSFLPIIASYSMLLANVGINTFVLSEDIKNESSKKHNEIVKFISIIVVLAGWIFYALVSGVVNDYENNTKRIFAFSSIIILMLVVISMFTYVALRRCIDIRISEYESETK